MKAFLKPLVLGLVAVMLRASSSSAYPENMRVLEGRWSCRVVNAGAQTYCQLFMPGGVMLTPAAAASVMQRCIEKTNKSDDRTQATLDRVLRACLAGRGLETP